MDLIRKLTNTIPIYLLYLLAFLLPLFFTPLTTEYFETGKLILLGSLTLILLFFLGLKVFSENKISLVKTPLDLLLILFLIVSILSTVFSQTPYPALYGLLPKVHGSLIFITLVVLLYFMVVSNIRTARDIRVISQVLIFSGVILALVTLLSYFKIYETYTLTGSSTSTAAFLTLLLPLSLSLTLLDKNLRQIGLTTIFGALSTLIFTVTTVLIGNLGVLIAVLLAYAVTLFFIRPTKEQLGIMGILGIISLSFAIAIYTPTLKDKTPLGNYALNYQKDLQLPITISWKISASSLRDSPILGTGPGTYLYNFTKYKPLEINRSDLWDKRIGSAHNFYFQTLSELGGAGLILLLLISVTFAIVAFKNIDRGGLALSGIIFLAIMATSPMSVLTQGTGFLILALFMGSLRERHHQISLMEANLSTESGVHPLLPTIVFVPILALVLAGFYFIGKLSLGEYYHKQSLNLIASSRALDAYNQLIAAERTNPQIDLYRVNLAQTNFTLANSIATQKGPTEASPGGSLTDDDRRNIQTLLQQSIAEGRASVTLSPRSAVNWEVLANIYRQISGVAQNATSFSLDAYGRAIQNDPLNPVLRVMVGGIYYQAKNYDLAVRFFDDAVVLKPDYSNGLYNLAIALREKGNITEGIRVAERLVTSLQDKSDSQDYITATELLSKLKETQATVPLQDDKLESPLDKSNVPDLGLPEPQKISTPPAIQR